MGGEIMVDSPKYSLNVKDLKSMAVGLLITSAGAALVYLADVIIPNLDMGTYGPILVPILALGVNAVRKYVSGTKI